MSRQALSAGERNALLELARVSIADRLRGDGSLEHALARIERTARLEEPSACFVTLKENVAERRGRLRGCIGTLEARDPLYRAVIDTAAKSAFSDPRFPRVSDSELQDLRIEISVLTPSQPVAGPEEILVGRDGVELEGEGRRAVFLPQVPVEYGWDVRELLEQLSLKAGLPRDGWRGGRLYTFQAEVFGES